MDVKPLFPNVGQGWPLKDPSEETPGRRLALGHSETPVVLPPVQEDAYVPAPEVETSDEDTAEAGSGAVESGGVRLSFQFDLFYQLEQKVSAKMGQSGANRFTEVAGSVAETLGAGFSMQIDAVGSFMKGTDASLDISAETTNAFFDSVAGLTDGDPAALEDFLQKSEQFFDELKQEFGGLADQLEGVKDQFQEQAKTFFAEITQVRESAQAQVAGPATTPPPEDGALPLPADSASGATGGLIPLVFAPGKSVTQDAYQEFLQGFGDYVRRFQQSLLQDFFSRLAPAAQEKTPSALLPSSGDTAPTGGGSSPVGSFPPIQTGILDTSA